MADRTVHTLPDFFQREKEGMNPGDDCICLPIDKEFDLRQIVLDYCVPMLGAEKYFPDLFGKYGYTFTGIGDGWQWNFVALQQAPDIDLWKMLAISSVYWLLYYEREDKQNSNILARLNGFLGVCEADYFGYDRSGNIEMTAARIFSSTLEVLKEHFKKEGR